MKDLHPSWHLLVFALSIIAGDILVLLARPTFFASPAWLILSLALLIFSIFIPKKITLISAALAGILLIAFRAAPDFVSQDYFQNLIGRTVTVSGRVLKDPDESTNGKLNLTLTDLKIDGQSLNGTIFTQVPADTNLQRSDYLELSGELSESFGTYSATIFRPDLKSITRPEPGDAFLEIRNFFAEKVKAYIPAPESGLALGYLLGQKSGVDKDFQEALRLVGLTHIIVASGAHLGVLVSAGRKIFGKVSRFAGFLMAGLLILIFIGITGLSASMLRAGLVAGLSLITSYVGRKIHPARLISLVAAATLIFSPLYLTDLAWLLSFASFSAILILSPALAKFFYGPRKKPKLLGSTLISSFSAFLLTAPILLYFFGQISLISIVANLLVLPTVSLAMGLTFITGASAILLPPLAVVFGKITTFILDYQITVVNLFAGLKQFLIKIDPENPLVFLLYLPLIVVIITTLIFKRKRAKNRQKSRAYACYDA